MVSLDESDSDSILTFPCGYDTPEYSWVKAYDDIRALVDSIRDATKHQQQANNDMNQSADIHT